MLHLLGRAVSLFVSVIIENKVLKLNRMFSYTEFLYRKLNHLEYNLSRSLLPRSLYII